MFSLSVKKVFKAEQRLVFGKSQSRHIRLFFILPHVLIPHFYRVGYDYKPGNAEEFSPLFNRLLLSRHSVSGLQLQFPPEV